MPTTTRSTLAAAAALVLDPLADLDPVVVTITHDAHVSVQFFTAVDRREAAARLGLADIPDLWGDISRPHAEQAGRYADMQVRVYSRADESDLAARA